MASDSIISSQTDGEKAEAQLMDIEGLQGYLIELEECVFEFDGEKMLTLLEAIEACASGNIAFAKVVQTARRKVEKSDYMSAVETIAKELERQKEKGGNAS